VRLLYLQVYKKRVCCSSQKGSLLEKSQPDI
jgi:hypothetical protein